MEKLFKNPETGATAIITDKNHLNIMERYGYVEVKEVKEKKTTKTVKNVAKNPTGRGRKHMSDSMCLEFFADAEKMTVEELITWLHSQEKDLKNYINEERMKNISEDF